MAEAVGFEPTRRLITDLSVFKTDPFSLLGTPPYGGVRRIRTFETFRFAALAVRCNRPDSAITPYVMQDCRTCGKLPLARLEVIAHALFFRFLTKKRHSLLQRWRLTSLLSSREFHLLCRGCYDSWQRQPDLNWHGCLDRGIFGARGEN